jgi:hypothetical protein
MVETAGAGAVVGRAIASEVAVQALSMVIAIKMCRNLTSVRCSQRKLGTAASTYN